MSIFTTSKFTSDGVTVSQVTIPVGGSGKVFMFTVSQGQKREKCVLKVDTQNAVTVPVDKPKTLAKYSAELAANLVIMAQLFKVAAKPLGKLRCLLPAEVAALKAHVERGRATETAKQYFLDRNRDGTTAPQVWYLMNELKSIDDMGFADTIDKRKDRGESEERIKNAQMLWQAWAQLMITKPGVLKDLGSICAVDFFIGNRDRFDPYTPPPTKRPRDVVVGMPGNVLIGDDGPVGLDFFDPSSLSGSYWNLYAEHGKDKNDLGWFGYFLSESNWQIRVPRYPKAFDLPLAERKQKFAKRVVAELMRLCDVQVVKQSVMDGFCTQFLAGMQSAETSIQTWVSNSAKAFCKDIGVKVPTGLAARAQSIWGK